MQEPICRYCKISTMLLDKEKDKYGVKQLYSNEALQCRLTRLITREIPSIIELQNQSNDFVDSINNWAASILML